MEAFRLNPAKLLRIENGRGATVRVERGSVWLTQGSFDDVLLQAGESCRLERDGITLISVLRCACTALVTVDSMVAL